MYDHNLAMVSNLQIKTLPNRIQKKHLSVTKRCFLILFENLK